MVVALLLFLAAASPPVALEAYFEVKLLVRDRVWGQLVEIDQWTGGRLLLRGTPGPEGATVYRLAEVLETPWTFRWYPTKDEVKLGAAVHVEQPSGDPYSALAAELDSLAREKHAQWWDADEAAPGPAWSQESGRFWRQRHAGEVDEKDALPQHPTYPFHVLGPLEDRFGFTLDDGVIEAIVQRITEPWLADGWSRSASGEVVEGYGFWESKRPDWEPRTYETFAAALALLESPAGSWSDVLEAMQPRVH